MPPAARLAAAALLLLALLSDSGAAAAAPGSGRRLLALEVSREAVFNAGKKSQAVLRSDTSITPLSLCRWARRPPFSQAPLPRALAGPPRA
jgi:hypothetical protein